MSTGLPVVNGQVGIDDQYVLTSIQPVCGCILLRELPNGRGMRGQLARPLRLEAMPVRSLVGLDSRLLGSTA